MSHPLKRLNPNPAWPSFTGQATFVGTSPSQLVHVYVDATLGLDGTHNAHSLIVDSDRVLGINQKIFGIPSQAVNVLIYAMGGKTDGTGGADHGACDFKTGGDIEVCASFGNPARVSALFEAEYSECCMNGNLCGVSTGEALSRWCATVVSSNALADFATAPHWFRSGMPDFVTKTDKTDQSGLSTGCGMAFLSWLRSLGFELDKIAPAMVTLGTQGVLSQLYAQLSGDSPANAWGKFHAALTRLLRSTPMIPSTQVPSSRVEQFASPQRATRLTRSLDMAVLIARTIWDDSNTAISPIRVYDYVFYGSITPKPAMSSQIEPFHAMAISRLAHQLKAEGRSIIHMEFGQPQPAHRRRPSHVPTRCSIPTAWVTLTAFP